MCIYIYIYIYRASKKVQAGMLSYAMGNPEHASSGLVVPEPTDMAADVTLPLLPSNGRPSEDRRLCGNAESRNLGMGVTSNYSLRVFGRQ